MVMTSKGWTAQPTKPKRRQQRIQRYWHDREEDARAERLRRAEAYEKYVERIHRQMLDEIQKEIDSFYRKYALTEGITMAEAKKRASKLDMEEYARKAERYVREKDFSDRANAEMKLYNMTMKANRLELLKAKIGLDMVDGYDQLEKLFGEKLNAETLKEFQRQAGILGTTVLGNASPENIEALVNGSFHNATWSDRIWAHQDLLRAELDKLLTTGIIQGKNPNELARELRKTIDASTYNSERLLRTELARVQTDAQRNSYEANGFEEYEFIACGGPDVCPICKALDGEHFKVKDMDPGTNAPPMHPNCHCSTAPYEDDDEYEAWLDFLDNGGSTEEWDDWGKGQWAHAQKESSYVARKRKGLVKASARFVNQQELFYRNSAKIKKLPQYDDFVCHGTPHGFFINIDEDSGIIYEMTPKEYADRIRRSPEFHGKDIRIISCQTGSLDYGAAQQLADELGVCVYAPTETVSIDEKGRMFVSDNDILAEMWYNASEENKDKFVETGSWRRFKPHPERR